MYIYIIERMFATTATHSKFEDAIPATPRFPPPLNCLAVYYLLWRIAVVLTYNFGHFQPAVFIIALCS